MQPDSSISQEQNPSIPEKKPRKLNIKVVLLIVLVLVAAGLGYWNTQLNQVLERSRENLATLDGRYRDLTAERDTASSDLDLATSDLQLTRDDLAATNETLATVEADLAKANEAIAATKKKMGDALAYVEFMRAYFEDRLDLEEALEAAKDVNDSKVEELFKAFTDAPNYEKTWVPFVTYLLSTVVDILTK